ARLGREGRRLSPLALSHRGRERRNLLPIPGPAATLPAGGRVLPRSVSQRTAAAGVRSVVDARRAGGARLRAARHRTARRTASTLTTLGHLLSRLAVPRRLLAAVVALAAAVTPSFGVTLDVVERQLPNGLHVLVHPDHSAPVVSSYIFYRSGSRNEK